MPGKPKVREAKGKARVVQDDGSKDKASKPKVSQAKNSTAMAARICM